MPSRRTGKFNSKKKYPKWKVETTKEVYEVERFIGKRIINNQIQYLVKWKNYTKAESTWEPFQNLFHLAFYVNDYEQKLSKYHSEQTMKKDEQFSKLLKKRSLSQLIQKEQKALQNKVQKKQMSQQKKLEFSKIKKEQYINDDNLLDDIKVLNNSEENKNIKETNQQHQYRVRSKKKLSFDLTDEKMQTRQNIKEQIDSQSQEILDTYGNFNKNTVKLIASHSYGLNLQGKYVEPDQIYFQILWEQSQNNKGIPKPSYYSIDIVKDKAPIQLLDYYIENSEFKSSCNLYMDSE